MRIPGRLGRARVLVAEFDAIMDVIADRLHQRPTLRSLAEQGPRRVRQAIGLAVAATEQIDQDLHRQVFQCMLLRLRGRRRPARPCPASENPWTRSAGRRGRGSHGRNCRSCRDTCWRGSADQAACDPASAGRESVTDGRSASGSWASAADSRRKFRSRREFFIETGAFRLCSRRALARRSLDPPAALTFTATFMAQMIRRAPNHVPCSGIASRG